MMFVIPAKAGIPDHKRMSPGREILTFVRMTSCSLPHESVAHPALRVGDEANEKAGKRRAGR